jgi:hypothetical protein
VIIVVVAWERFVEVVVAIVDAGIVVGTGISADMTVPS